MIHGPRRRENGLVVAAHFFPLASTLTNPSLRPLGGLLAFGIATVLRRPWARYMTIITTGCQEYM